MKRGTVHVDPIAHSALRVKPLRDSEYKYLARANCSDYWVIYCLRLTPRCASC
jgi:hypothetical protein